MSMKHREFVDAARTLGLPGWRIMLVHMLPNALGPVLVTATIGVAGAILTESALSFLGFGVQPPNATWGNILADGRNFIFDAPWLFLVPGIAVAAASDCSADRAFADVTARRLISLNFPLVDAEQADRFLVCSAATGLSLRSGSIDGVQHIASRVPGPYRVGRRDPLGRAIGRHTTAVVDATAGLGGDMVLMLTMGVRVIGIEQSPLLFVLLSDRLDNASGGIAPQRFDLHCADSNLFLDQLVPAPQVIYLDPMFPARRKTSALPKKELVELRSLAARPESATALLSTARRVARSRVVVKRLPESAPIAEQPDWSHEAKTVRYDVYRAKDADES